MEQTNTGSYYYNINISYEIPYNVLDSEEPNIVQARDILYSRLKMIVPEEYEKFAVKLVLYQLKDNYNYLVTYSSFFRSQEGLPMQSYVSARDVKEMIEKEIEEFFKTVDCEYRKINVKTFN